MNAATSPPTPFDYAEPAPPPVFVESPPHRPPAWTGPAARPPSRRRRWRLLATRLPGFIQVMIWALLDRLIHRPRTIRARCAWLSHWSVRTLQVLNIDVRAQGRPPQSGLLVSNHLGYLDILVLASQQPLVFVAKAEVRRWPLIGWLARLGGTQFIDRDKRADVGRVNAELAGLIEQGIVVAIFPEGTSSGGGTVLPFFSSLLAPAAENRWPVTPVGLGFALDDGSVEAEVAYWRDMTFLPHLLNLLTKQNIQAVVKYGTPIPAGPDRKALARQLQGRVRELLKEPCQSDARAESSRR